jgi:hypothetical protein
VSFSRFEGFGWAIADALLYGAPIVARRTGVLTLPGLDVRGVAFYDEYDELVEALCAIDESRVSRSLEGLEPSAFRRRLEQLLDKAPRQSP